MEFEIGKADLKAFAERKKGFLGVNAGKVGSTFPWAQLDHVGLSELVGASGSIELLINDGGLTNKKIDKSYKFLFKKEVLPAIQDFIKHNYGIDRVDTFDLILHFRERMLQRVVFREK